MRSAVQMHMYFPMSELLNNLRRSHSTIGYQLLIKKNAVLCFAKLTQGEHKLIHFLIGRISLHWQRRNLLWASSPLPGPLAPLPRPLAPLRQDRPPSPSPTWLDPRPAP